MMPTQSDLRTTLHELADAVPPVNEDQLLAHVERARRPTLLTWPKVLAVAAAVMTLLLVPLALIRNTQPNGADSSVATSSEGIRSSADLAQGPGPRDRTSDPSPRYGKTVTFADAQAGIASGRQVDSSGYQIGSTTRTGAPQPMPGIVQFSSPGLGTRCVLRASATPQLACTIPATSLGSTSRLGDCATGWDPGLLILTTEGAVVGHCVSTGLVTYPGRALADGDSISDHGFACRSSTAALTCINQAGRHGFVLRRGAVDAF